MQPRQSAIHEVAVELDRARPRPGGLARAEEQLLDRVSRRPELRAAVFRLVDVAPACRDSSDLAGHLSALLEEAGLSARLGGRPTGLLVARAVRHMAARFIVGSDPCASIPELARMWEAGQASTLDLLGEATLTAAEGQRYAGRCLRALRTLAHASAEWPARERLERDGHGSLARANLSIKLSALTPLLRGAAPELADAARPQLRALLRAAREQDAHVHIDAEVFETHEAALALALAVLGEPEFREGPQAGLVLQAYLRESPALLERMLAWARSSARSVPISIRLVKGAYWDAERASSAQRGWPAPVFEDKRETDRNFEALTRRLIEQRALVRPLIASHNLRSLAHAIAFARAMAAEREIELQVLRGLGNQLAGALAAQGLRVRVYCPVGDLVAGMAYLVRRLLENTSNESFLHQAQHATLEDLVRAP